MIPRDYEEPMSTKEWVFIFLILMIPLIGIIMLIRWAIMDTIKTSKRNFARAQLLMAGVSLLLMASYMAVIAVLVKKNSIEQETGFQQWPAHSTSAPVTTPTSMSVAPAIARQPSRPTLTPNEPTRSMRSIDGRAIEARVISVTDEHVTIVRVDGRQHTVEISRFSPADIAYFRRLRGAFD